MSRLRHAAPLLVLGLQNLAVFWSHYWRGYGFTWDFIQSYFGMNAFSVAALQQGMLPQWQPFQCMGYPFALNLQSGFYYPPLWAVAALGVTYDLRAATILQCLHVLFGALGAYALLRRVTGCGSIALIGASMFQFFGGFYSNAQHPDVVRAFAVVPWVFFAAVRPFDEGWRQSRFAPALLMPLFVYLLATGGYPGNLMATCVLLAWFLCFQLVERLAGGGPPLEHLRRSTAEGSLVLLGLAIAAAHLAPAWIERGSLVRSTVGLAYRGLWLEHLPLLFHSSSALPGEPSMTSTYLTVPGLVLVFFVSWERLRRHWPWAALLVASVLMVAGPRSAFWNLVVRLVEPLRLSRFPSSDYRPLIAVALIVFAGLGLQSLREGVHRRGGLALRGSAAVAAVALAGRALYGSWTATPIVCGAATALATVVVLSTSRRWLDGGRWGVVAGALVVLITIDAFRVLPDMETWKQPEIDSLYARKGWGSSVHGMVDPSIFEPLPSSRPGREETGHPHWYSWAGYLEGRYMMADKAPCLLATAVEVLDDPLRKGYMQSAWTPLLVPVAEDEGVAVDRPGFADVLAADGSRLAGRVRQTRYGLDEIAYEVTLPGKALLIENEIFFAGWQATLDAAGEIRHIRAFEVADGLRAWPLPAGTYSMVARFRLPHQAAYRLISLSGLAVWFLLLLTALLPWTRRR